MGSRLSKTLLSSIALLGGAAAEARAEPPAQFLEQAQRSAKARTPCSTLAADVASEVSLRLWQRHREFVERFDSARGGYVDRCVQNRLRDEWRSRGRRSRIEGESGGVAEETLDIAASGPDAVVCASVAEFRSALRDDDRRVLHLLEDGGSEREIARVLGTTRHQVRGALTRIGALAQRHLVGGPAED